jgi:hypothetical protein|eukprot:COSAG01_NODE_1307_length_10805_cov_22.707547_11_plen_56_part_00
MHIQLYAYGIWYSQPRASEYYRYYLYGCIGSYIYSSLPVVEIYIQLYRVRYSRSS